LVGHSEMSVLTPTDIEVPAGDVDGCHQVLFLLAELLLIWEAS
jgi:hypothetical protein